MHVFINSCAKITKLMLIVLGGVGALSVGACQTPGKNLRFEAPERNTGPCPESFALHDAARFIRFEEGKSSYKNIQLSGEITRVSGLCRYIEADPIDADLNITFEMGRGLASGSLQEGYTAEFNYFVSVTRKNIVVLEKQYFPLLVSFPAGVKAVEIREKIEKIIIPRAGESVSGENFEIIVGFDLTSEQIEFNQEGKRFRVSVGQNR